MFVKTKLMKGFVLAFGGSAALWSSTVLAQDAAPPSPSDVQRVIVTGSNIRRTDSETPSPVQVITDEDLKKSGYTSVQQVLQTITANGQGTLSQGFSGAFASGASGIALRGLNVGATLVLIDGHRMAPYPIGDDGQRSFVDISNIPFDSIERVEILKDGASAIYGSDAIAGVVNIILKRSFVGAKITADLGDSWKNDGQTAHVAATFGTGDLDKDGHNFYIAAEARKQYQIKFEDRPGLLTQTDFTSSGGINTTPGATNNPLIGTHPRSGTGYITDPSQSSNPIVGFMPGCNATSLAANQCTYKDSWDQIQPNTENVNLVSRYTQKLGADWQGSLQATFFQGTAQQIGGPGRALTGSDQGVTSGPGVTPTLLNPIPATTIPSTNPSFPKGTGLDVAGLRYTFFNLGPTITDTHSQATRLIGDINGSLGAWNIEASAGYTGVQLDITGFNYINYANLQTALNSTTDPFLIGQQNSAELNQFVAPTLSSHDTSTLSFGHVGASRDLMDLKGGPLSVAFGADYTHRIQHALAPADVANGLLPNQFSNNFTVGTQSVWSADAEIDAPVLKSLDLDAAVRYDHYNLSGGKASPKVGFKWTPVQEFALRGTASKGFRAPGPAENGQSGQTFFAGSSSDPILCPSGDPTTKGSFIAECDVNLPGLQSTNPKLHPETSKSFTLGTIIEPVKGFSATIDLWQIEIDNQIVSGGATQTVRGTSLAPLEMSNGDGTTSLVAPPVAPIAYTTTSYINANTTKTNGVDLGFQVRHRFGAIEYQSDLTVSYAHKYDLTIDGTTYHLAGTHGPFFYSGDTGNPRTRIQWANTVGQGPWNLTGTLNYISSFNVTDPSAVAFTGEPQNDCLSALSNAGGAASTDYENLLGDGTVPSQSMCKVHSFITFDMQGRYDITKNVSIHGSILNLFNKKFPADWATYGGALGQVPYNPSMHEAGAIGRYFTLGGTYTF